jgi:hypothetical protein
VQHWPDTHFAEPEQLQSTVPQELLTLVPHWLLHVGRVQQWLSTQVVPPPQLNVREPQEFVTVPQ